MKKLAHLFFAVALLSISCQPKKTNEITFITSAEFKKANLPFSEMVIVGNTIYLSGQVGSSMEAPMVLVSGGIKNEARQALENIKHLLESNGSSMENVVKCTVMLADINEWGDFNSEYVKFFPGNKPARSAFATNGLALGARVEIECIAVVKK